MRASQKILLIILFFSSSLWAMDVEEIVKKANHQAHYRGDSGRAHVDMTIKDNQGRERSRKLTILRLDKDEDGVDGRQKFYIYFKRPKDIRKMAFLVWKKIGKDDDRWLYIPSLDLIKRIAGSDKRTSFVGSDFFYEDVSGRGIKEDKHELLETTEEYYVLKNTPKKPQDVEFSYYKVWVHKESFIPVKTEYYKDKSDKPYRIYEVEKVSNIQGIPTVIQSSMKSVEKGSKSTLNYSKVEYNVELDEDIFTERYLRKPPRKQLRF